MQRTVKKQLQVHDVHYDFATHASKHFLVIVVVVVNVFVVVLVLVAVSAICNGPVLLAVEALVIAPAVILVALRSYPCPHSHTRSLNLLIAGMAHVNCEITTSGSCADFARCPGKHPKRYPPSEKEKPEEDIAPVFRPR